MTTTTRQARRMAASVKQAVTQMNYAQRRLFELRTEVPTGNRGRQIDELEALFRAKAI